MALGPLGWAFSPSPAGTWGSVVGLEAPAAAWSALGSAARFGAEFTPELAAPGSLGGEAIPVSGPLLGPCCRAAEGSAGRGGGTPLLQAKSPHLPPELEEH